MAFEVITISLGQHSIAVTLCFMPLAFINVFVGVDHAALSLGHSVDPVAVITVTVLVEEGSSAVFLVLEPVASVLTPQFLALHAPVGALAVSFIKGPHAFVLVACLVVLDSEAFFTVVAPVADVFAAADPFVAFDASILASLLLLDPEDSAMSAVFLSLRVVTTEGVP